VPFRAASNLVEGLLLLMMVVLCVDVFLGVFSRYVIRSTFTWYDEIARLLFVAHKIPVAERDQLRQDLLAYCERDTWATVRLLEELRNM